MLLLCAALLFAVYFTQLELPWVSFLAGVDFAQGFGITRPEPLQGLA